MKFVGNKEASALTLFRLFWNRVKEQEIGWNNTESSLLFFCQILVQLIQGNFKNT